MVPNALVVSGFIGTAGSGLTADSGLTIVENNGVIGGVSNGNAAGYLVYTSGSINITWTDINAVGPGAVVVSFTPG